MSCLELPSETPSELPSEIVVQIARSLSLASLKTARLLNYHYSQAIGLIFLMPRCAFMHHAHSREIRKNAQFYYYGNNLLKCALLQTIYRFIQKKQISNEQPNLILQYFYKKEQNPDLNFLIFLFGRAHVATFNRLIESIETIWGLNEAVSCRGAILFVTVSATKTARILIIKMDVVPIKTVIEHSFY